MDHLTKQWLEAIDHDEFHERRFKAKRKFKAYAIRRGEAVGVGIEEHRKHVTLAIVSIYVPYKPSHKELFDVIASYIVDQLEEEEIAYLRLTSYQPAKYSWKRRYNWRLFVRQEPTAHYPFIQTQQLAEDALKRQTTIIEDMPQGVLYRHERR